MAITSDKKYILENMVILVDSREKANFHIIDAITELGGKYEILGLKTADYACKWKGEFIDSLIIERKNSLTELSANVTKYRERFENELARSKESNSRMILLIEDDNWNDLFAQKYRSNLKVQSFLASIMTYQERYNLDIVCLNNEYTGRFIFNRFYYHIRELKK